MNGHVVPRPSAKGKRWQAMVYVDKAHGGPRWKSAGTYRLEREARAALVKMLDSYLAGTYRKPSRLTVAGLYEKWVAAQPEWSANTLRHHTMNWQHHIKDRLGDEMAEWLGKDVVAAWQADLLRQPCAPKSVLSYRGTLHAMYAWGLDVDLVTVNPVSAVRPPKIDRADHDALSVGDMRAYLAALRRTRLWSGLLLAAGGGLRRGEFLAVRWQALVWTVRELQDGSPFYTGGVHIDAKHGNLTGRVRAKLVFGPVKTKGSAGFVPLPSPVLAELAALKDERRAQWMLTRLPWDESALVCCGAKGQPIIPDGFTHELGRFCRRNKLVHTHPHAFRHGVIEAMLDAGERLDVVQRIARHTTAATTLGVYAHATERAKAEASMRYGALWDGPAAEPEKGTDPDSRTQVACKDAPEDELGQRRQRKRPA